MIDYRYRFPDEQTMLDLLAAAGMVSDDGTPIAATHQYALDVIGVIPPDTGYCANLRVIDEDFDVSAFAPYIVVPKAPVRVWA